MNNYCLLDARAGCTFADEVDLDDFTIILIGTAQEICDAANSGEYGEGNVPATLSGEIPWNWFCTDKWIPDEALREQVKGEK